MNERTKTQLRQLSIMAIVGAGVGLVYMPLISDDMTLSFAFKFAAQGLIIVLLVFSYEMFVARGPISEPLRRAPFVVALVAKTLITTAIIVFAFGLGGVLLFPERFEADTFVSDLIRDTGFSLGVAAVMQFVILVRDVVGGRVLTNILLGRYHRPLNEQRLFMFLDVSGSTALAERLGGVGAYSMISRLFFDVAQETVRHGGETHAYIGDEVVVSWPLERGIEKARCLQCYFAIRDRIDARADFYKKEFGSTPTFRVGLHGGPVVAGECGDDKREIVYFGDTINTAARIQEACKEFDRPLLISGDLVERMDLSLDYGAASLGKVQLRGREKEIELFAVERLVT